ncbi:hypothetical protein CBR_g23588 [Chara braunii]|uniref:Pentacotripeptide-repeat region of PRORP domain-containing protein n=1 Tax=Chara braunii TaxID=69332 RepID=A0A388L4M4_CHABU|nr:hypothetical protein CBR_g23588 [Chara braunii]|eukprot:GBG77260.1 hypothetical protein CBR_g23588 [Chara braunii]
MMRFSDAERVFGDIERAGLLHDPVSFTVRITNLGRQGRGEEAEELVGDMLYRGMTPDKKTWTALIIAQGRSRNPTRAEAALRAMLSSCERPHLPAYTALVNAYGRAVRADDAQRIFDELLQHRFRPSRNAFTSLIEAYGRTGDTDKAIQTFEQMWGTAVSDRLGMEIGEIMEVDEHDVDLVTSGEHSGGNASKKRSGSQSQHVPKHICRRRRGLDLIDDVAMATVVRAARLFGAWEKAAELVRSFERADSKIKMKEAALAQGPEGVQRHVKRHMESPGSLTYTTLIDAYSRVGRFDDARRVFVVMEMEGIRSVESTYVSLHNSYARVGLAEEAAKAREEMEGRRIRPTLYGYLEMLRGLCDASMYSEALDLWTKMHVDGCVPTDEQLQGHGLTGDAKVLTPDELTLLLGGAKSAELELQSEEGSADRKAMPAEVATTELVRRRRQRGDAGGIAPMEVRQVRRIGENGKYREGYREPFPCCDETHVEPIMGFAIIIILAFRINIDWTMQIVAAIPVGAERGTSGGARIVTRRINTGNWNRPTWPSAEQEQLGWLAAGCSRVSIEHRV